MHREISQLHYLYANYTVLYCAMMEIVLHEIKRRDLPHPRCVYTTCTQPPSPLGLRDAVILHGARGAGHDGFHTSMHVCVYNGGSGVGVCALGCQRSGAREKGSRGVTAGVDFWKATPKNITATDDEWYFWVLYIFPSPYTPRTYLHIHIQQNYYTRGHTLSPLHPHPLFRATTQLYYRRRRISRIMHSSTYIILCTYMIFIM